MRRAALLISILLLSTGSASAVPAAGQTIPGIEGPDVTGQTRALRELVSSGPTLLVTITDRHSVEEMRAWFDAADEFAPEANRVSVTSLKLPFFVSPDRARSAARDQIPPQWWPESLLDTNGHMGKELGVAGGRDPWAFAVDGDGRVLAAVHGRADTPQANQIWRALAQQ